MNGVVTAPLPALRIDGAEFLVADPAIEKIGPPVFRSVLLSTGAAAPFINGSGVTAAEVATIFNTPGTNTNSAFVSTLTNTFVNGANETAATATDPKTIDALFDTTAYVGAVRDATDTWYEGWTCSSATANFGTTSTACTSLPSLN